MCEQLTKKGLALKLGISRPTLDKYLENGFPDKIIQSMQLPVEDDELKIIMLENDIRLLEYHLKKKQEELAKLKEEN